MKEEKKIINPVLILDIVCDYYNVEINDVIGESRLIINTKPRKTFCYLARLIGNNKFKDIAKTINRKHSTCIHFYQKAKFENEHYTSYVKEIKEIKKMLNFEKNYI